ncbi:tyrosine-protein kinase YwqD [Paenibacillus marchantiophytorum]|uniref:non-specific protein-tyrosine kinase n=1 Tax=Paenibacillus marchantiophytorum TaxID=1619310 RepID=A0ABQ2BT66_9BACL|nr:CpsD/CapB family tyrosine-protein kinase [Paenibacillus marchantiophytorum]GGI46111.1 tyrosine-protein kinase YwqD [Paenibacillus marchantiophytorum]
MPKPSTNVPIMMQINPHSPVSEAYRSLRFNIECSALGQEVKTITVTSASRGEGKTTTAINLAVAYAQIGKKVLLLDADLRNPSIHMVFNKENTVGLTTYLGSETSMEESIQDSFIENLWIMTSGAGRQNPSELLASKRMAALLTDFKAGYDLVIVDTPSVLTLTDAKLLAAQCDGVLLVVEYGKVKRNMAKKVKEELMMANAKLIGVVLNEIKDYRADAYL